MPAVLGALEELEEVQEYQPHRGADIDMAVPSEAGENPAVDAKDEPVMPALLVDYDELVITSAAAICTFHHHLVQDHHVSGE